MKTKTTGLILALCFFGAALCFADDPHMGTSKLNESKSKLTPGAEKIKPTYISLVQFTDKGIQAAKQTTQHVAAWAAKVQSMGVTIKAMYWTLGQYDQVCIFEAPWLNCRNSGLRRRRSALGNADPVKKRITW